MEPTLSIQSVRHRALALVVAGALGVVGTLPRPLRAQMSAGAGLGALMQRQTNDPWTSATRFDPTLRFDGRWFQATSAATLLGGGADGVRMDNGSLDFVAAPPSFGVFRVTTTGSVQRQGVSPVAQRTSGTVESALSMRIANWGGWLGVAAEHTREIANARVQPLMRLGFWRQFNNVTLSVSRESHSALLTTIAANTDTGTLRHDTVQTRNVAWSNVQARLGWSLDGVYFDTRFGMQPKVATNPQAVWARASATVGINSRLSLVAEAGNQPIAAWTGMPAKRFASLGVRVAPAALIHPAAPANVRPTAASFALSALGHDAYIVSMRVPNARAVELSGDFNGWKPVALREARPDVWETTLTLRPGTYHVNARVNGEAWTAPPGLPATNDEFNGMVGLIVVR